MSSFGSPKCCDRQHRGNHECHRLAVGWLSHTVRGAMAGALKKKLGLTITSDKIDGRGRVYRIPD
jgi:hypothetical protein